MTSRFFKRLLVAALLLSLCVAPRGALACAACYGDPNAPQTHGMNLGIFTMLGVTGFVLASFGGMIFCFARRARRHSPDLTP
jgi:heme/copper-type cytochrome/quinol oxidase subunit 2